MIEQRNVDLAKHRLLRANEKDQQKQLPRPRRGEGVVLFSSFRAVVDYHSETLLGKNASRIAEYIQNQLKEDELGEQLTICLPSPFTGSK